MSKELSNFGDTSVAAVTRGAGSGESIGFEGVYHVVCYDEQGNVKWEDDAPNLVTAAGKESLFNFYFGTGTGGGTASGANYLGLLGGTATYTTGDTMASHAWTEVGGATAPLYTGNRQSPSWTAASTSGTSPANNTDKTHTTPLTFAIVTTGGTVNGCFLVTGTGAVATKGDVNGTLYSAGTFTGGAKAVVPGDSLAVTYKTTASS